MSHKLRYVILTIILLGLMILFVFSPKITAMIVHVDSTPTLDCENTSRYYDCVRCCQENANTIYGKQYYGVNQWNAAYDDCWNNYCQKLSN